MEDFRLTQRLIENAHIYDEEKQDYIKRYLVNYFVEKFPIFQHPEYMVMCHTHGMECYTVDDVISADVSGWCTGKTFADWENTLTMHSTARFHCKGEFQIGCWLKYSNRNLIKLLEELSSMSDGEFLCGKTFDEGGELGIITGHIKNNFWSIHGCRGK